MTLFSIPDDDAIVWEQLQEKPLLEERRQVGALVERQAQPGQVAAGDD